MVEYNYEIGHRHHPQRNPRLLAVPVGLSLLRQTYTSYPGVDIKSDTPFLDRLPELVLVPGLANESDRPKRRVQYSLSFSCARAWFLLPDANQVRTWLAELENSSV